MLQAYLEQIANYIKQNTGIDNKVMNYDPNFSDPFTGGGRYVPEPGWFSFMLPIRKKIMVHFNINI